MKAGARGTQITISHLDNANWPDGEVPLSEGPNLMGQHTFFASSADGPGGSAMWNQGAKTLTLFAVKDVECTVEIQFSFTLEVRVCLSVCLCVLYICASSVFLCRVFSRVSVCLCVVFICGFSVSCVCVCLCVSCACVCVRLDSAYIRMLVFCFFCVSLCLIYLCIFYFFCLCVSCVFMCLCVVCI